MPRNHATPESSLLKFGFVIHRIQFGDLNPSAGMHELLQRAIRDLDARSDENIVGWAERNADDVALADD